MAELIIDGLKIEYEQKGTVGRDVILLHGWGQNIQMMDPIAEHLKVNFRVFNLDFPGFGKSELPHEEWGVEEYAVFLHQFAEALNIKNPILIGHSFGCRVAFHYAAKHPVSKMVLTGAAGIRPKRTWKYYVRTYLYKTGKLLVKLPGLRGYEESLKQKFGSADYKNSSGMLRQIFVKTVNDDVTDLLEKMTMPVLLVWGEKDEAVPLSMAKLMESKIPNAGLAVFENEGHYAYFNQIHRFNRVLDAFFQEDKEIGH